MGAAPDLQDDGSPPPDQPKKRTKSKKERPMRMELVERIRQEIAAGTYETKEKWEAALDGLLDNLHRDD
jgi:anti-sigma28 factor (negative regulator of flagellin synthesis)